MAGTFSPRGGPRHAKSTASLVRVLGVLGVLHGVAGGLVHHPLHHPFGAVGPLTVVRHAPPAVPPYSTQVNIFRWLAAFPPPVLHRALVLAHGHPLHLHPPAVHHAPLPPPPPPVLPPPPPPLATPVAKTPVAPLPLSFNFPPGTGFNLPLDPAFNFNFPPDALPFAPGLLPTSAFLPARGLFPGPLPAAAPFPAAPFPAAPFPAAPFPVSPTFRTAPTPLPPLGFAPNGLLPGAFGTALPPINFDFGRAPSPSPPQPQQPPHHGPAPAGLTLPDGFHQHYRQYVPAANGITRATAGNLAL